MRTRTDEQEDEDGDGDHERGVSVECDGFDKPGFKDFVPSEGTRHATWPQLIISSFRPKIEIQSTGTTDDNDRWAEACCENLQLWLHLVAKQETLKLRREAKHQRQIKGDEGSVFKREKSDNTSICPFGLLLLS